MRVSLAVSVSLLVSLLLFCGKKMMGEFRSQLWGIPAELVDLLGYEYTKVRLA